MSGGAVQPGDVVAVTMYAAQIYTGVGGDKFGVHWSFEDVSVVCQRSRLAQKTEVSAFAGLNYNFAMPYESFQQYETQFSETLITNAA